MAKAKPKAKPKASAKPKVNAKAKAKAAAKKGNLKSVATKAKVARGRIGSSGSLPTEKRRTGK